MRYLLSFLLTLLTISVITFSLVLPSYADTINVYANTDPESSTVGLLIDAMRSDPGYDPHNQYICARISDSQYRLAFGADLTGDVTYYTYTAQSYNIPASIVRSSGSALTVRNNGYYFTGNALGGLSSSRAETYKYQSVLVSAIIIIVIFILFKLFRRSAHNKLSYYNVR